MESLKVSKQDKKERKKWKEKECMERKLNEVSRKAIRKGRKKKWNACNERVKWNAWKGDENCVHVIRGLNGISESR